jgi:uncharacterized protein (TIGR00297 family)
VTRLRRAGGYALVGTLALLAPALVGWGGFGDASVPVPGSLGGDLRTSTVVAALPFLAIAVAAATVIEEGPLFEIFARPGDYEEGHLYGLAGFALAVAGLTVVGLQFGMPLFAFVASVFVLVWGDLAGALAAARGADEFAETSAFAVAGTVAGTLGHFATVALAGGSFTASLALFLAASVALLAALLRSMLYERDDPLVMVTVALVLWLFAELPVVPDPTQVAIALALTVALGVVSYVLEAASVTGMFTGVLLALLTVVLGSYGWFALLISFFGIGALSTKFRYEEKRERGIAQSNEGARGSGNVLANSAVALAAVLGFAAAGRLGVPGDLFFFAFAGSVAAATSDTLSSEIGGLYDRPRLITTMETVPPGTNGGVTWQGGVAGLAGAAVVAAIALVFFPRMGSTGAVVVTLAGFVGMVVDSLLGATLEGVVLDNMGVNFFATLAAAGLCVALAITTGVVAL